MLTFIVTPARAHNQAYCPEPCSFAFMRQAHVPGCGSCQPTCIEKNSTGRDSLVSGKRLPAKNHCKTLRVSTSKHLHAVSMVRSPGGGCASRPRGVPWKLHFSLFSQKGLCSRIRSHEDWNTVWCISEGSLGDRIIPETPEAGVSERWPGS